MGMGVKTAFAYLLAGTYLWNASYRAGLGLLLTGGIAGIGPDFVLFLAINVVGLILAIEGAWYFIAMAGKWLSKILKRFF